jgi:hypothetical protein
MLRPRRRLPGLLLMLGAAVAAHAATSAPAAATGPAPAEWRRYDILVHLHDLPRTYSCDDLWYKFRDLLLAVGARVYMTISPYHCGYVGGGPELSPSVEVKFQLPALLHGGATRYEQISAVEQRVHLAPGAPRSLKAQDCALVSQLPSELFAALPVHLSAASFSCRQQQESFDVTLAATLAVPSASRQASAAARDSPRR